MICVNEQSPIIVTLFCLPECLCEFFPYTVTDAEREWVRGREREMNGWLQIQSYVDDDDDDD